MAREFDNSGNQYLKIDQAVVASYPLTMACWFNMPTMAHTHGLMWVGDKDYADRYQGMYLNAGTVRAYSKYGSGGIASATSAAAVDEWHHACAVFTNATLRASFLDGGSKDTDTTNVSVPAGFDRTALGVFGDSSPSAFAEGMFAEAAVWNVALTDAEVESLGAGYCPLFIRPQYLVAYWPLIRDRDINIVGGYDLTAYGSPTVADHCRILRPTAPQVIGFERGNNWRKIVTEYSSPTLASLLVQNGTSGSFMSSDGYTITVTKGIITSIV